MIHISTLALKGKLKGKTKRKWIELSFSCGRVGEARKCPTFCSCYDNGNFINDTMHCRKFATSTTTTTTTTTTTLTSTTTTTDGGGGNGGGNTTTIIIGVTIPVLMLLIMGLMLLFFLWTKRKKGDETLDKILFCIKSSGSKSVGTFHNLPKSVQFSDFADLNGHTRKSIEYTNYTFGKAQIFTLDMLEISNTLGRGAYGKVIS